MNIQINVDYGSREYMKKYTPPELISASIAALFQKCGVSEGVFNATLSQYDRLAVTKKLFVGGRRGTIWLRYRPTDDPYGQVLSWDVKRTDDEDHEEYMALMAALKALSQKLNSKAKKKWLGGEKSRKVEGLKKTISFHQRRVEVRKGRLQEIEKEVAELEELIRSLESEIRALEQG